MISSGCGILQVPAEINHNRENPTAGYDHRIPASTFLPFSGVFPPKTATFPRVLAGNPGYSGRKNYPESCFKLQFRLIKMRKMRFRFGSQNIK
jgi:hypothetical protein